MNKQELIKKYVYMKRNLEMWVCIPDILEDLKQLDEPQKVTVPQFVADWIERERKSGGDLEDLFNDIVYEQDHIEWFREEENMNLVARAWLDGFEIEKEKRFLVKMKGVDSRTNYLYYGVGSKTWLFKAKLINGNFRRSHTRKELEQGGFGWVFDCPGVEIEEVE